MTRTADKMIQLSDGTTAATLRTSSSTVRQAGLAATSIGLSVMLLVVLFSTTATAKPSALSAAASRAVFGTCPAQPSKMPLRWGSDPGTADHICCNNHEWAERWGYWRTTSFPMSAPAADAPLTFYDSATGRPLFIAPIGRSYNDFIAESTHHGWPSFRDAELVKENVVVLPGGETVSINGTHLGHNLPDIQGNRYCIDLVCIAGMPPKHGA